MKSIDTIATAAVSLSAVQLAPEVAEVAAETIKMPIEGIIQIFIQVVTGVATLYKLFFHKKTKKDEENV